MNLANSTNTLTSGIPSQVLSSEPSARGNLPVGSLSGLEGVPSMLDVAETLERLCREGASLEEALNASHEKVNELAHRTHLNALVPPLESANVSQESEVGFRDLHSASYLQNWLASVQDVFGKKLILAVANRRGTVVHLAYRGVDAAPFRTHSDVVGQVAREAIFRKQPLHSVQSAQATLEVPRAAEAPTNHGEATQCAESPHQEPKRHFSVGLNRLSQSASVTLNAVAFELNQSSGHLVLFFEDDGSLNDCRLTELEASPPRQAKLTGLIKELDAWYLIRRCHWSMRWMGAIDWCIAHPKSFLVPVGIIAGLLVLPVPYYPRRECVFEPEFKQYLTSPVAGRIASCEVRPGDSVQAGQLLARLDDDQLRRDLATAEAELDGATKKFDSAIATRASGDVAMAKVEIRRTQARIESLADQLKHMEVRAQSDGVVVQGDWKKSIGMPVTLGQNLFEIAELETMSAEVQLSAFDLGQIQVGDKVSIRSDASGGTTFEGEIGRIEPRATLLDEKAVFLADVVIKDPKLQLRPGMKAKAQIQAGWRSVGWILFARPYRWLANQWIW